MFFGLPDCDKVFMKYFDRWYEPEDRARKRFPATKPDTLLVQEIRGLPQDASPLDETAQSDVREIVNNMITAAEADWPSFLPVSMPMGIQWIDEFDKYHNKQRVKAVMKMSDPSDFSNELFVRCCEFGAVIGYVMVETLPGLQWVYDWPYWESSILDPESGTFISVFHWAIKKFSSYGIDDGFKAKIIACCKMIGEERINPSDLDTCD